MSPQFVAFVRSRDCAQLQRFLAGKGMVSNQQIRALIVEVFRFLNSICSRARCFTGVLRMRSSVCALSPCRTHTGVCWDFATMAA